ncbi:MAG: ribulokinase, partial [Verrucomicrobia bacterium]|nr:ribulokinase [Verrucomicrobiota bacterium]
MAMNHAKYVLGIDFGTFNGQAILARVSDGAVVASDVHYYSSGVITEKLPNGLGNSKLPSRFALQDPRDYLDVLKNAIPAVLQQSGVGPQDIIAIGTDFTSCTMLPVQTDGTPLCFMPKWRSNPHAWAKLWKHHSPQPQADRINEIGRRRGEEFLKRYGGRYSSEWFFAKLLETVEKAPEVYDAADEFIEASDWIVWQLVGRQRRGNCAAGYKAMWIKDRGGYPHYDFFKALHPKLEHVLDEKLGRLNIYPLATSAGGLSHRAAALTGLKEGTPVAVGTINAHAAVPACGVTEPGRLCMVLGPSICHMLLARERREVEGICGVVEDGILPGLWAYEAGQAAAGDILTWFCENAVPVSVHAEAERQGLSVAQWLERQSLGLRPGQNGLLALG